MNCLSAASSFQSPYLGAAIARNLVERLVPQTLMRSLNRALGVVIAMC